MTVAEILFFFFFIYFKLSVIILMCIIIPTKFVRISLSCLVNQSDGTFLEIRAVEQSDGWFIFIIYYFADLGRWYDLVFSKFFFRKRYENGF